VEGRSGRKEAKFVVLGQGRDDGHLKAWPSSPCRGLLGLAGARLVAALLTRASLIAFVFPAILTAAPVHFLAAFAALLTLMLAVALLAGAFTIPLTALARVVPPFLIAAALVLVPLTLLLITHMNLLLFAPCDRKRSAGRIVPAGSENRLGRTYQERMRSSGRQLSVQTKPVGA
jgi:hypothetical protein